MQALSSISSHIHSAAECVGKVCATAYTVAKPYVVATVHKVHDLWTAVLPALKTFLEFSSTRFGFSVDLLVLSMIPFGLSKCIKNTAAQVALIATGVLMVAAGAFLMSGLPIPGISAAFI